MEEDLEELDKLHAANAQLVAAGIISLPEWSKNRRYYQAMARRCKGKLFGIKQRMQEREIGYNSANKGVPLVAVKDSFGVIRFKENK